MQAEFWTELLHAWMHDPPDKAIDIKGHEQRAVRYAAAATFMPELQAANLRTIADQRASLADRLPFPSAGEKGERAVGPENGKLRVVHPLSGAEKSIDVPRDTQEDRIIKSIVAIVKPIGDDADRRGPKQARLRFLALWRRLPEELVKVHASYAALPADTRVPDHTIWHHADTTAAFHAAGDDPAFLSFSIGPVQPFIEASRSVRDLWTGSMILSQLAFAAMVPVLEKLGPTAFVFPSLRGVPLMDLWLRAEARKAAFGPDLIASLPSEEARMAPCLPNRFLALVPAGQIDDLVKGCREAAIRRWQEMARGVREALGEKHEWNSRDATWATHWNHQVDGYFNAQAFAVKRSELDEEKLGVLFGFGERGFEEAFDESRPARKLADSIPEADRRTWKWGIGVWAAQVDTLGRIGASLKGARLPAQLPRRDGAVPQKCSLFGTLEQMGPGEFRQASDFWEKVAKTQVNGVRLRKSERFGAVALTKRFAGTTSLSKALGFDHHGGIEQLRFPDTATVAARFWLKEANLDPDQIRSDHRNWSGQWLFRGDEGDEDEKPPAEVASRIKEAREKHGAPPAYLAVLMMDGDSMGRWLRGEKAAALGEVMDKKMRDYFEELRSTSGGLERMNERLRSGRPVGPALHASISSGLARFATSMVPGIVKGKGGTLIYAGGDDVLALLPTGNALSCARELEAAFRSDEAMGSKATVSAGLVVVHYKEDLREALRGAREAEKDAKKAGRDALQLAVWRCSGEHVSVTLPWTIAETVEEWVEAFIRKATDRWAYKLRQLLPTLKELPIELFAAEARRQLARVDRDAHSKVFDDPVHGFVKGLETYVEEMVKKRGKSGAEAMEQWLLLAQSASFLARGRDR